jgi:hypothetical protein
MNKGEVVMARDKYDPYWMTIGKYLGKALRRHEIELPSRKILTYDHVEPLDLDKYFTQRFKEN